MKVKEVIEKLNLIPEVVADGEKEIKSAYCGDFLSFSISRQGDSCIWFTVMNNVNVAGVATLTDSALIVLCEDTRPDAALKARAETSGINVARTSMSVYDAAVAFYKAST